MRKTDTLFFLGKVWQGLRTYSIEAGIGVARSGWVWSASVWFGMANL